MKLAIADVTDSVYDAHVFLSAGSLVSGTTTRTGQSGPTTTTTAGGGATSTTTGGGGATTTRAPAGGATTTTTVVGVTTTTGAGPLRPAPTGTLARTGGLFERIISVAVLALVLGGLFLVGSHGLVGEFGGRPVDRRPAKGLS